MKEHAMNESISVRSVAHMHGRELSRISDALRTPLTSIVGFAEAILSDPSMESGRLAEFTRIIKAEGERLSKFVDEILYVSFSDPDAFGREQTEFDVSALIDTAIQIVSTRIESSEVRFFNENESTPFSIKSDKQFMLVILSNVLNNMVKFLTTDDPIQICANRVGGKIHFSVTARRTESNYPPSPAESIGLARTQYLVALRNGKLLSSKLETGETCMEVILPVAPAKEVLH